MAESVEQRNLRIRPPALPCTLPRHSPALPSTFEMLSTNLELPSSASSHSQRTQFLTRSLTLSRRRHPRPTPPRSKLLFLPLSPIADNANTARRDAYSTKAARGQTVRSLARCACSVRPCASVFFIYAMPLETGRATATGEGRPPLQSPMRERGANFTKPLARITDACLCFARTDGRMDGLQTRSRRSLPANKMRGRERRPFSSSAHFFTRESCL